jgi:hypothetical protein
VTSRPDLPVELRGVPFTRALSVLRGVSPGRLRATDISHPFHGVHRERRSPDSLAWHCRANLLRLPHDAAFSHSTAAGLYNLPIPAYARSPLVHVTRPAGGRPPEGRGVAGHELSKELWITRPFVHIDHQNFDLFELPVLAPSLVWAQLATLLDEDDLVAVADALVTGSDPLCTIRMLRAQVVAWRDKRGSKRLARAIGQVRKGPLSRPESLQRLQLVRSGIPEPELNVTVTDRGGNAIAMADEVWAEFRTLVEYEGDGHRTSRGRFRSDISRVERFADGDWFALRSQVDDVFGDPNPFVGRLWRRLVAHGWHPARREPSQIAAARR